MLRTRQVRVVPTAALMLLASALAPTPKASAQAGAQAGAGLEAALALENVLVDAIAAAEKSVVAIARVPKDPLVGIPRGEDPGMVPSGYGTGVVVDRRGLILTNYHVLGDIEKYDYYVWTQRRSFKVKGIETREKPGKPGEDGQFKAVGVEAADPWFDLAVLKIDADNLEPIKFGDAGKLKKGQIVIALGNPYAIARDGEASATWGIISNLRRHAPPLPDEDPLLPKDNTVQQYGDMIQTDAKLPQGASGGALLNLKGEMIGLTSSLAALSNGETTAGFAIPVDDAFKRVVDRLKMGRRADFGFLGVAPERSTYIAAPGELPAVRIDKVVPGTPAARAFLRPLDVVTHVDGVRLYDHYDLMREVGKMPVGKRVELTVVRDRRAPQIIPVTLAKKYLNTTRPVYGSAAEPMWRGMRVDYATATPGEIFQQRAPELGLGNCVAVSEIEPDSPAWKAGLRRWTFISHIEGKSVEDPEAFYKLLQGREGPVQLRLIGGRETVTVEAP
ncbi:MAG: trypsin-like peptidase domain-containing protein [Pirellulaceae bacterium]